MGGGAKRNVRDLQRSVAGVPDGDFQRSRNIVRRHLAEVVGRGEHLLHRTWDRPAGRRTCCRCGCVRASCGTAHCKQRRQTECNDFDLHLYCPSDSADRVRPALAFGWKWCPVAREPTLRCRNSLRMYGRETAGTVGLQTTIDRSATWIAARRPASGGQFAFPGEPARSRG